MFSINENNVQFANKGAVELRYNLHDEENLTHIIAESIQILQREFTRTSSSSAGVARLTATSTLIGEVACSLMGLYNRVTQEGVSWITLVRVGDFILESFFNLKYIDITFGHYDILEQSESYIVSWTPLWVDIGYIPEIRHIIHGTQEEPIAKTDSLFLPLTGNAVIKRFNNELEFKKLLDKPFIKAVDKLQSVEWIVNERILTAIKNHKHLFVKPIPDERLLRLRQLSKNYEFEMIVKKADYFIDKSFYQYMELDYRGRMYYAEPFLNFQGSDLSRGVLQFAKPKEMTSSGRWWLAVHTANSFNQSYKIDEIPEWCSADYKTYLKSEGLDNIAVDKMTLEDRVKWTEMHMEGIRHFAEENYIDDDAEKPVSFLACCIEWDNIYTYPDYKSHLPVPVDGSNNGWQHLGAISKDELTGELVGLVPVEIQRDFYVSTAKELISRVPEWFADRDIPMKAIRKGISKRGSMTRAYSAGAEKIAINMYADCYQAGYHEKYNISADDCKMLAKNLIKAIDIVCPGPLQTMRYLQSLAGALLDKPDAKCVSWLTPTGFPVTYSRDMQRKVKCRSTIENLKEGKNTQHKHCHMLAIKGKPDRKSFMSGISPNYIHSMDASHMALVIAGWDGEFGAVHDSFSCHASDVEELVHLTKSKFIEMYDHEDYFVNIDETFGVDYIKGPALGNLKIEEIHNSDYFFC